MPLLHLRGLPGPIEFSPESEDLPAELQSVLTGWPESAPAERIQAPPVLRVERAGDKWVVARPATRYVSRQPTAVSAICTLIVELVDAFVSAAPHLGSLHAAAAEFAGKLVVFPATRRAGKSTLAARLAASGRRVFSDDLLPIDLTTGEAVATGCLPRLRQPLPASSAADFAGFVQSHIVLDDGYYCYVRARDEAQVGHGRRAAIGAFVLLDRRDEPTAARLEDAPPEDALVKLLLQDTRRRFDAAQTLAKYHELVAGAQCCRLVYSDLESAVACLDEAFANWPELLRTEKPEPPAGAALPLISQASERFVRRSGVELRVVGESGFLLCPARNDIHRLNAIGLGLWRLLEEPLDHATAAAVFAGAFPDISAERIGGDIAGILAELARAELIERAETRV